MSCVPQLRGERVRGDCRVEAFAAWRGDGSVGIGARDPVHEAPDVPLQDLQKKKLLYSGWITTAHDFAWNDAKYSFALV